MDIINEIGSIKMPSNLDAEKAVIGSLLLDKRAILTSNRIIQQIDFYSEANRIIYQTIKDMYSNNTEIDLLTLTTQLNDNGNLEKCGGVAYVAGVNDKTVSASNIITYCRIVKENSIKRKMIFEFTKIVKDCYLQSDAFELLNKSQQIVMDINNSIQTNEVKSLKELLANSLNDILRNQVEQPKSIPTPYKNINAMLKYGGFVGEELYTFCARPGEGKTAMLVDLAVHAGSLGYKVMIFSMENSARSLTERIIANKSEIDSYRIAGRSRTKLTNPEKLSITSHLSQLTKYNIWIDDTQKWHIDNIGLQLKHYKMKFGIDIVMFDYLQLISGAGAGRPNEVNQLDYVAQTLHSYAVTDNIPIVTLAQLGRDAENKQPTLKDIRSAGGIEQASNVVFANYDDKKEQVAEYVPIIKLMILKNRDGRTGYEKLVYNKPFYKFTSQNGDLDFKSEQAAISYFNEPEPIFLTDEEKPF